MKRIEEPKSLRKVVAKKLGSKRERYWESHGGKPTVKRMKLTGLKRRLTKGNILGRVERLGRMSDVAVIKAARSDDLVRNLAFAIHQQRLWGSLDRLREQYSFQLKIPPKVEVAILASAFQATEEG